MSKTKLHYWAMWERSAWDGFKISLAHLIVKKCMMNAPVGMNPGAVIGGEDV